MNKCFKRGKKDESDFASNDEGVLYKIFKYGPSILFALYVILLFVFYALPVAKSEILNAGLGNVYSMDGGLTASIPQLKGCMVSLIVFASLGACFAIFYVLISLNPNKDLDDIHAWFWLPFISIYSVILILSIIICFIPHSVNKDFSASVCPILSVIFSAIFMLASLIIVLLGKLYIKKHNLA